MSTYGLRPQPQSNLLSIILLGNSVFSQSASVQQIQFIVVKQNDRGFLNYFGRFDRTDVLQRKRKC